MRFEVSFCHHSSDMTRRNRFWPICCCTSLRLPTLERVHRLMGTVVISGFAAGELNRYTCSNSNLQVPLYCALRPGPLPSSRLFVTHPAFSPCRAILGIDIQLTRNLMMIASGIGKHNEMLDFNAICWGAMAINQSAGSVSPSVSQTQRSGAGSGQGSFLHSVRVH